MQVKTFLGKNVTQVLAQVKSEMGPEAIILNSRDVSRGNVRLHEVVAGIERAQLPAEPDCDGISFALPQKPGNGNGNGETHSFDGLNSACAGMGPMPMGWRQWHKDWNSMREHILALVRPEMRLENLAPRQRLALDYLQREGVDDEVIVRLYRSLIADREQSVLGPLAEIVKVKPWGFKHWRNKIHLIAGPFGTGKTVTALRMGLTLRDEKPEAKIAIINADYERGHGRLISKHYCELLEIAYHEASSPEEMREALSACKEADRVLVDLPGLSANETMNGMLTRFGLGGKSSLHLVFAPYFSKEHLRGLLAAYEAESCASLIWTKLDEAYSFGAIANAAVMSGLPVSALSFSPSLTNSLIPAEAHNLWHLLFKHKLPSPFEGAA